MPLLPWKKTRASRISQIVADLQSPQHGGSLVVETGFPTSIVDLFVKHRDRLRKHSARRKSKKKRSKNEFHESTAQLCCSTPQSHPPEINSTGSVGGCVPRGNLEIEDSEVLDEARVLGDGCDLVRNRTETCVVGGGAAGGSGVCLVVLKMFAVAVLALSTKKLVVGITLSAFLLLLLEFVGKRAVRFLKPCARGEAVLRSLIHKVSKHLWIGKDDLVIQALRNNDGEFVPKVSFDAFLNESIDSPELSSSIEEILLVEPDVDTCETPKGIADEKHDLGFLGDEIENKDGTNRHGTRGKRSRRIFEKLVRKKSGSQAIKKNNNREEFRSDRFDKASIEERVNDEDDENLEQEQDRQTRSILCEEEQDSEKPPGFDEQLPPMEVVESCEIQWIQRARSMNYPILVLIVLFGLLGGRFLAVMLTTACCFMIKLNEIARKVSQNPPLKVSC